MSRQPTNLTRRPTCLFAHPSAELFGADRMLLESVRAAHEAGFDCVVVLPGRGPLEAALRDVGARIVISEGLVLRKTLLRPRNWPQLIRSTLRGLGSTTRLIARIQPDCVYVNTIIIPLWPLLSRMRGVPTVSHIHEAEAYGSSVANRVLYAPHLASQRVLVNSEFNLQTILRDLPRLARNARVVYNGVTGPAAPRGPRAELVPPLRLLFVGRLSPRKGPDVLIEAVRRLRAGDADVRLDILGSAYSGYEWFESQLREAVREHELSAHVVFHGFHDDLRGFFERSDVLVVPSTLDESFGNTAVEGVLALRPVIASDNSGLREASGGYSTTALVAPADPAALAAAIVNMTERWPEIVGSVSAARKAALDRHGPSRYRAAIAGELGALVRPAVGRSRASAEGVPASGEGRAWHFRSD